MTQWVKGALTQARADLLAGWDQIYDPSKLVRQVGSILGLVR